MTHKAGTTRSGKRGHEICSRIRTRTKIEVLVANPLTPTL
jgi:hypothetical protein